MCLAQNTVKITDGTSEVPVAVASKDRHVNIAREKTPQFAPVQSASIRIPGGLAGARIVTSAMDDSEGIASSKVHHVNSGPQEDRGSTRARWAKVKAANEEGGVVSRGASGQVLNNLCCQVGGTVIYPKPWRLFATVDLG